MIRNIHSLFTVEEGLEGVIRSRPKQATRPSRPIKKKDIEVYPLEADDLVTNPGENWRGKLATQPAQTVYSTHPVLQSEIKYRACWKTWGK